MEPPYDPQFFNEYLSGHATNMGSIVTLMAQVFAVLIGGIVLWRLSDTMRRKNLGRSKTMFEDSKFQRWKNKK